MTKWYVSNSAVSHEFTYGTVQHFDKHVIEYANTAFFARSKQQNKFTLSGVLYNSWLHEINTEVKIALTQSPFPKFRRKLCKKIKFYLCSWIGTWIKRLWPKTMNNQSVCKRVLKIDMTNKRNQRISTWHHKARCS